jgi:hypothetical protein
VGFDHLQRVIAELAAADESFPAEAAAVARLAVQSDQPEIVRRGLQVAAALLLADGLEAARALTSHPHPALASDARAAAFVLSRLKGEHS